MAMKIKDPEAPATKGQRGYLWAFENKFSVNPPHPGWYGHEQRIALTKGAASLAISTIKPYMDANNNLIDDPSVRDQLTKLMHQWNPAFAFPQDTEEKEPEPEREPETEPEQEPEINRPKVPRIKTKGYIKPPIFDDSYLALSAGLNLLVYGPAGCGKSRMAEELAKVMDLEFFPFSVSGGQRYSQVFGGDKIMVNKDGVQYSDFVLSELLKAVQRPCLILLDEVFGLDPDVAIGLNGLLEAGSRSIMTKAGLIKMHPECRVIACANTNGRVQSRIYTAASRADGSLLDRFVKRTMDYSEKVETKLAQKMTKTESLCSYLLTATQKLRKAVKQANIAFDVSTRRLLSAIHLGNIGIDPKVAFEMAFLEDLSHADRAKVGM